MKSKKVAKAKEILKKNSQYSRATKDLAEIRKTEALMMTTLDELENDIKLITAQKLEIRKKRASLEKKALEEGDKVTMTVDAIEPTGEEGGFENPEFNDEDADNGFDYNDGDADNKSDGAEEVVDTNDLKKEMAKLKTQLANLERKAKVSK